MSTTSTFRARNLVAALATGAALVLAGSGSAVAAETAAASVAPAPLTIEERLITTELAGLPASGEAQIASTPEEFAQIFTGDAGSMSDGTTMTDETFVEGAVQVFKGTGPGGGLSIAVETTSEEAAIANLMAFEATVTQDLPAGTEAGTLPGPTTSSTYTVTKDGKALGYAAFVDGNFVYIVFAGGPASSVDPQEVIDATTGLYETVQGAPAA